MNEMSSATTTDSVEWSASEFVSHEKNPLWYGALTGVALFVTALVFFITKDRLSSIVVLFAFVVFGIYAGRKPNVNHYRVDHEGLKVGESQYSYDMLRSFSIIEEGAIDSIWVKPLRKAAPMIVMYFEPADEDRIVDVLSQYLPHEERELDFIDRMTRKIRF